MKRFVTGKNDSSTRWLTRQASDPYVQAAKARNYRSRAAFKLIEMDDKLKLLRPGLRVVDLGAAPGGWTQVAVERAKGKVVAIDILEMSPIAGAEVLQGDFMAPETPTRLIAAIGGSVDIVLSDLRGATTGHREVDHLRAMGLVEAADDFAAQVLRPGGAFVAKVVQGGEENAFIERLRREYATVRRMKPPASRVQSAEFYVVATGYRGNA